MYRQVSGCYKWRGEIGCKEEFCACREDDDLFANSHQPRDGKHLPSKQVFANKLASSMLTNECGSLLVTKAIVWRIFDAAHPFATVSNLQQPITK